MRVRSSPFLVILVALASGCAEAHGGEDAAVPEDAAPPPRPTDLDLLLAVDGSSSVGEEQWSFVQALPALLAALASGDADGDGVPEGRGFETIQIGVVTSDMGVGGHTVPGCAEADFGDDGALRDRGAIAMSGCMASYPRFLRWEPGLDLEEVAASARCVARVGTGGCGFEQPLEGLLKAISPSAPTAWTAPDYVPPMFYRDTPGHADGVNDGFVRAGSLLAVLLMTDEDDCSASDPEIYRPDSETYARIDLGRRCDIDEALHPIARYRHGLLELRSHPSFVAFFPIAGIPADLQPPPGERHPSWELYVGDPGERDPRLVPTPDPLQPTRDIPSCNVPGRGVAFAPTRILELAHRLDHGGARVGLGSVCREDFGLAFESFARLLLAE